MPSLRGLITKLARSGINVLITRDTGTGKECVANAIHQESARMLNPMVSVNCAVLPDGLVESELFGYERGAFTGAHQAYLGKIRSANRGTVFLDEICPYAQAKLLRVLENHEMFRLGAKSLTLVDFRFIAATNTTLEGQVKAQTFRQDLYYRLNIARIHIPPLSERRKDIPELFRHRVEMLNSRYSTRVGSPSTELLTCMQAYHGPGNVRELRNLVETIFIDSPVGPVSLKHLPDSFQHILSGFASLATGAQEKERLAAILSETNCNKTQTAKKLNWCRMMLYRKLPSMSSSGRRDNRRLRPSNRHCVIWGTGRLLHDHLSSQQGSCESASVSCRRALSQRPAESMSRPSILHRVVADMVFA